VVSLASLSGGPQHGYALIKDIEEIAGVTLGPGTPAVAAGRFVAPFERDRMTWIEHRAAAVHLPAERADRLPDQLRIHIGASRAGERSPDG
jgi:hypothetical protein